MPTRSQRDRRAERRRQTAADMRAFLERFDALASVPPEHRAPRLAQLHREVHAWLAKHRRP